MILYFADDSGQEHPSRNGMGAMLGAGAVAVASDTVGRLESAINRLCDDAGFPPDQEFKWSPSKNHWMRDNLVESGRQRFFAQVLQLLRSCGAVATVVAVDTTCAMATRAQSHEIDVTALLLERVQLYLHRADDTGLVITDRPSGGRRQEDEFLLRCLEVIQEGTDFVLPDRIALNVVSSPSKFVRLLQAADLVTSCTLARVSGERKYSPSVFGEIKPMLLSADDCVGGVGLKLHPDFRYVNLYYWLLGDTRHWFGNNGVELPVSGKLYCTDSGETKGDVEP